MEDKLVYISGPTGQLGKVLRQVLSDLNIKTFVLSRSDLDLHSNESWIKYNLGDMVYPSSTHNNVVIFHLGYDLYDNKRNKENINFIATKNIIKSFKSINNKKIIYISTQNPNIKNTNYNFQKYLAETLLDKENSLILRTTLIYSKEDGLNTIFAKIKKYIPFHVPIPFNENKMSPINVNKFIEKLIHLSLYEEVIGKFFIKGKKDITFKEFLLHFHGIHSFYLSNRVWRIFMILFKHSNITKLTYLFERIEGYLYMPDVKELSRNIKTWKI